MNSTKAARRRPRPRAPSGALAATIATPRFAVYAVCVLVSLSISYLLGKDMMWDTLDYHLYAGFSALHDRFGQDYFAAGTQSYFNPYVYVPFYLLATSKLSALTAASILATVQAGILWLSYELAVAVVPHATPRSRIAIGVCAALLALANPILINQLGTSSADMTTTELVLAGWLCLVHALRQPSHARLVCAGLLLGAVSALKLTNSVHALSACVMLFFLPATWRMRLRYSGSFGLAMICGLVLVAAPWAIHLERHFGNPLFPLLNGVFHSPDFPTSRLQDLRFVPDSIREALWRPFATIAPVKMVDDEFAAPDLRYAVLTVLTVFALLQWLWRRLRRPDRADASPAASQSSRLLMALGSAFLIDWALWLTASGNGRYFMPMACVAAALVVALLFRLFTAQARIRNYLLLAILAAQAVEVCAGATYREHVGWDGGPWFEISAPKVLVTHPALYIAFEEQSNSFVIPFLAPGSGFINVDGDYVLGPQGATGRHIRRLIRMYSPDLRSLVLQAPGSHGKAAPPPDLSHENDTLAHFGLRVDTGACDRIRIRDVQAPWRTSSAEGAPGRGLSLTRVAQPTDAFLVSCRIVRRTRGDSSLIANERVANEVFDRLERACPELFQPAGSVTLDYGDARAGYAWVRRYGNTDQSTVIAGGIVKFIDPLRGGPAVYLGRESDWEKSSVALSCWRHDERYYAVVSRK